MEQRAGQADTCSGIPNQSTTVGPGNTASSPITSMLTSTGVPST